jgi:antitoxin VapB
MEILMQLLTAKVFKSGNSQAIRLPKEFRLNTEEIFIYKSGNNLIITPKMNTWTGFSEGLSGFSDDFNTANNLPTDIPRKGFE